MNRRKYTEDFKQGAIKLIVEEGYSAAEATRNLGVDSSNLKRWVLEHKDQSSTAPPTTIDQDARIRELEKENKNYEWSAIF
jgi:transposase